MNGNTLGRRHSGKATNKHQHKADHVFMQYHLNRRLHAEADGVGLDSPGPGAYNHNEVSLEGVTSRYRKPANVSFGTGERFRSNYLTF